MPPEGSTKNPTVLSRAREGPGLLWCSATEQQSLLIIRNNLFGTLIYTRSLSTATRTEFIERLLLLVEFSRKRHLKNLF